MTNLQIENRCDIQTTKIMAVFPVLCGAKLAEGSLT
jgi:hypothetical protein